MENSYSIGTVRSSLEVELLAIIFSTYKQIFIFVFPSILSLSSVGIKIGPSEVIWLCGIVICKIKNIKIHFCRRQLEEAISYFILKHT